MDKGKKKTDANDKNHQHPSLVITCYMRNFTTSLRFSYLLRYSSLLSDVCCDDPEDRRLEI